ncbi:DedA family protein [Desulfosporosinus sp. BG]|uniref:DedA family protein n=1 Tax=Desulfosporosinus sp. BG TaxID=1633135 RepID=UPI000839F89A|nr:DedA family protein [Desulfosporosinus sp. BG]ODA40890.1 Alkaline phosphatase like protein [Desulfosporosinus sp. BG]
MTSQLLFHYITQYGYAGLYLIVCISILGLPIPDELLMTFVGFLTYSGQLNPVLAILFAALGCCTAVTIEYLLGSFFQRKVLVLLKKHAGSSKIEKVLSWYQRHGRKLLTVGYFIPGMRHISGYVAGMSRMSYRNFAFFAYLGAILWTTLFITLGRLLGSQWETLMPIIHRYSRILGITTVAFILIFFFFYKNHDCVISWLQNKLSILLSHYQSLGKQRFIVLVGVLSFTTLFIILMGLIQDLVFHEVGEFDNFVVSLLEATSWPLVINVMRGVNSLGIHMILMLWFSLAVFLVRIRTKLWTHVLPLAMAWGGGAVIDYLFRFLFRGESVDIFTNLIPLQAPSSGFLVAALSFYVFLGYLIGRNQTRFRQILIIICEAVLMFLLAISPVYLRIHAPSTMVTALTVTGLWAFVCVFVYEFSLYQYKVNHSELK